MLRLSAVRRGFDLVALLDNLDAPVCERGLELVDVDYRGIVEHFLDRVTELTLELGHAAAVSFQFPVSCSVLRRLRRDHRQPVVPHQLVVVAGDLPVPGVRLDRTPSDVVVVNHDDVVVGMTPVAVDVCDDMAVAVRVHLLRQGIAQLVDPLDVLRVVRVHLGLLEALDQTQCFNFPTMHLSQCL